MTREPHHSGGGITSRDPSSSGTFLGRFTVLLIVFGNEQTSLLLQWGFLDFPFRSSISHGPMVINQTTLDIFLKSDF